MIGDLRRPRKLSDWVDRNSLSYDKLVKNIEEDPLRKRDQKFSEKQQD